MDRAKIYSDNTINLCLGTVNFGIPYGIYNAQGITSIEEIRSILLLAKSNGVSTIDTAIEYGYSEQRLGDVGIEDFRIITKLPRIPDSNIDITSWIQNNIQSSLSRLKIKKLWGLLLHHPDDLVDKNGGEIIKAVQKMKSLGSVHKFGVSIYDPEQLDKIYNSYKIDIVQVPFNVFDRRIKASGWLEKLAGDKVEVHARSIFLQGLLLMDKDTTPKYFDQWNGLLHKWHQWLLDNKVTPVQACLQFIMKHQEISKVIVGVESCGQLSDILEAYKNREMNTYPNIQSKDLGLIKPTHWPN